MGENTKTQKKSWFKGLKAEFNKIVWPDKNTLAKQTTAVVAVSVVQTLTRQLRLVIWKTRFWKFVFHLRKYLRYVMEWKRSYRERCFLDML